ncbi:MAG: sigma-54-dependent Fis family transcriptional regulator [Myxococcales bacterium]|nr:sigma-54-dependent Fis family transcriptional regulator [Myxococcales bacterium]MCB9731582.1 sigma-54-dependent Fis family transcriptional regulator [Deltaproteobacteria bacterium]
MNIPPQTLLIVDDDRANLESLERIFVREKVEVVTASDGKEALDLLRRRRVSVILTDLMMPGISGLDLLRASKTLSPETEVIMMTAFGTVETAVEAMKEGAWDFVTKPFKRIQIVKAVLRALDQQSLVLENQALKAELQDSRRDRSIIGNSLVMRQTLDMVRQVAPSNATVLLMGESGTGKELFARAVHNASNRAQRPFIAINCAALPESLLEAELFGHEKGSFTGATARRQGRFELADRGTLFLDEVGETSPAVQVKLLRVLQEGEFERVGGTQTLRVDARIVAATNKDLKAEVQAGRFREDLFYRLNVISLRLPALRERKDDVPLLVHYFLARYAEKNGKRITGVARDALDAMMGWSWPGNVRELENAMERAVVLCRGDTITVEDLPPHLREGEPERRAITVHIGTPLEEIERTVIRETLNATRGDKRLAAQLLGIATRTIYRKI